MKSHILILLSVRLTVHLTLYTQDIQESSVPSVSAGCLTALLQSEVQAPPLWPQSKSTGQGGHDLLHSEQSEYREDPQIEQVSVFDSSGHPSILCFLTLTCEQR